MNAQMAAGCCTCVSVLHLALKCSSSNCQPALQATAAKVHLTCGLYVEVCTLVLHTLPLGNPARHPLWCHLDRCTCAMGLITVEL